MPERNDHGGCKNSKTRRSRCRQKVLHVTVPTADKSTRNTKRVTSNHLILLLFQKQVTTEPEHAKRPSHKTPPAQQLTYNSDIDLIHRSHISIIPQTVLQYPHPRPWGRKNLDPQSPFDFPSSRTSGTSGPALYFHNSTLPTYLR